ncbi:ABC transporter permease [Ornithinibacillus contaminans]|uniref:ABC transporter permease n=1 Tax=Ornithinibacillus contaminans TaxID=694055 RepID=UPI00064DE9AA|nr:ABC transporter permease [Ornithinibacillus contaminans]
MKAISMQCRMEIIRIFRNPYFVFWTLFMPIVFYFIFTKIVNANIPDRELWQAHYLMSMTTFSLMGSAIMTFGIVLVQERSQGWSKFLKLTPLPSWAYITSKMIAQSVVHIGSIIIIFLAGIIINGVSLSFVQWLTAGAWILLASFPFLAMGTLVGTMKKVETAAGVSNILYLLLAILGGMWFPMSGFPDILQAIGKWLPSYNYGNGAWEIVRGNFPEWSNILVLSVYLIIFIVLSSILYRKQDIT